VVYQREEAVVEDAGALDAGRSGGAGRPGDISADVAVPDGQQAGIAEQTQGAVHRGGAVRANYQYNPVWGFLAPVWGFLADQAWLR